MKSVRCRPSQDDTKSCKLEGISVVVSSKHASRRYIILFIISSACRLVLLQERVNRPKTETVSKTYIGGEIWCSFSPNRSSKLNVEYVDKGPKFRNVRAMCKIEWTTYREKQFQANLNAKSPDELPPIAEELLASLLLLWISMNKFWRRDQAIFISLETHS